MSRGNNGDNSFYYNAGLVFGRKFGNKHIDFRKRYVDQFKSYVDRVGGPETFPSVEIAVESFFYDLKRSKGYARKS